MANYPYNFNPYMQDLQTMRENIDRTMRQYQQQNQNLNQPPQTINQNFQLAPLQQQNELEAKYANDIEDVKKTFVMKEGIFINRDRNTLWIKNISGDIKTYSLTEVIEIDPKDQEINDLKNEIATMRALLNQQVAQTKIDNKPEVATTTKTEKKSK